MFHLAVCGSFMQGILQKVCFAFRLQNGKRKYQGQSNKGVNVTGKERQTVTWWCDHHCNLAVFPAKNLLWQPCMKFMIYWYMYLYPFVSETYLVLMLCTLIVFDFKFASRIVPYMCNFGFKITLDTYDLLFSETILFPQEIFS